MSEIGYILFGFIVGAAVGFHVACVTMKNLLKNEPEKFAKIFKKND